MIRRLTALWIATLLIIGIKFATLRGDKVKLAELEDLKAEFQRKLKEKPL
jgi:hypothetical protein